GGGSGRRHRTVLGRRGAGGRPAGAAPRPPSGPGRGPPGFTQTGSGTGCSRGRGGGGGPCRRSPARRRCGERCSSRAALSARARTAVPVRACRTTYLADLERITSSKVIICLSRRVSPCRGPVAVFGPFRFPPLEEAEMSTDLYGVRVLSVDPGELRVDFRVFVVYYDTAYRHHMPPPDDPGFFFFLLWEAPRLAPLKEGPQDGMPDIDSMLDFGWTERNAHRYVSRVERTADRNHPPTEEQWERLHDFYYERDGGWKDEDLLVSFDYRVHVTDRRWLEPLRAGDAWGTTMFRLNSDTWTAEDAPHIPDLSAPAVKLHSFASASGDFACEALSRAEFSDDGRYLAVCTEGNRVWVYDTADWTETAHVHAGGEWIVPVLMWVPGRHVLTLKTHPTPEDDMLPAQWAFDVDALEVVDAPFQEGHRRSPDGAHRILRNGAGEGGFDLVGEGKQADRRISHAGRWDPIQC